VPATGKLQHAGGFFAKQLSVYRRGNQIVKKNIKLVLLMFSFNFVNNIKSDTGRFI